MRHGRGLLAAGLVAWGLMTATDLLPPVADQIVRTVTGNQPQAYWVAQAIGMVKLYALFGIPIALAVTLMLGGIAWLIADRRGWTTRRDAARIGAATGALLATLSVIFTYLSGLRTQADDSFSYQAWRYGRQVIDDGMPTAFGWLLEFAEWPVTVAIGAVTGWVAWRVAQPRR